MKRITALSYVFLLAFICLLSCNSFAQQASYPDTPRDIVVQVRTVPESGFPMMKLTQVPDFTLYGDGRVIYSRVDENQNLHVFEAKLTPDQINDVLSFINREGFRSMDDNYMTLVLNDLDTTYMTVKTKDYEKTVKVYGLRLAAYQGMLPRGVNNIYKTLTTFKRDDEIPYNPEKISLYVALVRGDLPDNAHIVKWKVPNVDLSKIALNEPNMMDQYQETVFEGKDKDGILEQVGESTLLVNRMGFINNYFKQGKCLFKVGYRPRMPYE